MDLLRLPLVVLIEVFKNMEFHEKFLISLLSKRAKNIVRVTSTTSHLSVLFDFDLHIRWGHYSYDDVEEATDEWNFCIGGEMMRIGYYENGLTIEDHSFRQKLLLIGHLLDIFPKATFTVGFYESSEHKLMLEFMKMINQRRLPIKTLYFMLTSNSSELRSEILDECLEVTDYIMMHTAFPDDFVYTPSRPFKAEKMRILRQTPWFDLESFINCRSVSVQLSEHSQWTSQYWNSFFTNWMDSDAPLQRLMLHSMIESENRSILDEMRKQGSHNKTDVLMEMKRGNGSEFFIYHRPHFIDIYTKQAYLENLEEIEQRERNKKRMDDIRNNQ
uniref:F-box domain-containing protein n=1 Tax=Caenorhabditis tropicalis TaxID=1561998 RepID=A0A1I7UTA2_9PELO